MKRQRALLFSLMVVLALCAACGMWLHRERQQYALNRRLIDALEHDDARMALMLVNKGADPNTRVDPLPVPSLQLLFNQFLHHARPPANRSATAFSIACGTQWRSSEGDWFPVDAIREDPKLLQAMLIHGANVNAKILYNSTALHNAIMNERRLTVELLLQHGAQVNAQNEWGTTPLMVAATHDTTGNIVTLLLAHRADPNVQNRSGATALHEAVSSPASNAEAIIPQLLTHGADPHLKNQDGQTPLMRAQEDNHPDLVRLLQQHSAK